MSMNNGGRSSPFPDYRDEVVLFICGANAEPLTAATEWINDGHKHGET
jgi:hypothetical protein